MYKITEARTLKIPNLNNSPTQRDQGCTCFFGPTKLDRDLFFGHKCVETFVIG